MISRCPNSLTARSTAPLIFSSLDTSVSWKTALPPFSLQSRTAASPPSTFRSAITTAAPSPANLIAVARPIPLAAPVITATLPLSLPTSDSLRLEDYDGAQRVTRIDLSSRPQLEAGNGAAAFRKLVHPPRLLRLPVCHTSSLNDGRPTGADALQPRLRRSAIEHVQL